MKKTVYAGNVAIGGNNKISVQSMTNTLTKDINATISQINALANAGCDIVRIAVSNSDECKIFSAFKKPVPLVADIQYDLSLAICALENGADKVRINPQNSSDRLLKKVCDCAKAHNAPIRIGINYGSVKEEIKKCFPAYEALVFSAMECVKKIENFGFYDIVLSVKSSDVLTCIKAYRLLNEKTEYPLHLGVTEAGDLLTSAVKSSAALGCLLLEGIGDTIRISITGNPITEVETAFILLKSLGLRKGLEIISCPTCSRTSVDLENLVQKVKTALTFLKDFPIKVAIMGCAVNGIGEAKDANFGVAASNGKGVIFAEGKRIKTVEEDEIINELIKLGRIYQNKTVSD